MNFRGGRFRIYRGVMPKKAAAFGVIGLDQSDAMGPSKFAFPIQGKHCALAANLAAPLLFSGVARAGCHQCSPDSFQDDCNEIQIKQLPGKPQRKTVACRLAPPIPVWQRATQ